MIPAEGGILPHRTIPELGQETARPPVLVVPVPLAHKGPSLERVSGVETGTEDPLGRGAEGDRGVEEPVEDPESLPRQEVQSGSAGLPHFY